MIYQLEPADLSEKWEVMKEGLKRALDDDYTEKKAVNLLNGIMDRSVQAFVCFRYDAKGKPWIYAFFLTCFQMDFFAEERALMIYALANIQEIPSDAWASDFVTLKEFARGKNCSKLVAYSKVQSIVTLAHSLGFHSKYSFLTYDL